MEVAGGVKYDHKKEDCPYVLSIALQKKYGEIPKLGCMMTNKSLMNKINNGLKKHGHKLKQIYSDDGPDIDVMELGTLLAYLVENKKDGFFVLEHNNPKETRHLFAFLYNHKHHTLDFFDSYNKTRTLYTLRMDKHKIGKFIKDVFNKYFEDEFLIEKCFEINPIN